jgi:hypothetical protein
MSPKQSESTTSGPVGSGWIKLVLSLGIATVSDGLNLEDFAIPLIYLPVDIVTASLLFLIWGRRYELLLVLIPEAIPALNLFPTWTAVVLYLFFRTSNKRDDRFLPNAAKSVRPDNFNP